MLKDRAIQDRYPQLHFLLTQYEGIEPLLAEVSHEDIYFFINQVYQQKPALILLIGIELWRHALGLEPWLREHLQADILLFEKDLGRIKAFLQEEGACDIVSHPQVHLHYVLENAEMEQALKEALHAYPSAYIFTKVHPYYQEDYPQETLDLMLLRKATRAAALLQEKQYYHVLSRNLLSNFTLLPTCFYADALKGQFKGIPAIICGAGPSLQEHIPFLKQAETKALILAGGSTIAALTTQGVHPHLGFISDPNPEEYDRLKANTYSELPLLFGARVLPSVFHTHSGLKGYMRTLSGGPLEEALEKKLGLALDVLHEGMSVEGMSSTIMCVAAASFFGCSPILLCGIDLAYVEGKRYAEGVVLDSSILLEEILQDVEASERRFKRYNREGDEVYTCTKWIMEGAAIEDFAKHHQESHFIDCGTKGLGFPSLPKKSLQEALEQELIYEYDLKNYVHLCINRCPHLSMYQEVIQEFMQELKISCETSLHLIEDILKCLVIHKNREEHPLVTLYQMDLEDEKAFQYFLQPLEANLAYLWQHVLRKSSNQKNREKMFIEKKWTTFQGLILYYLELFQSLEKSSK
jgi:hypothetical protein